MALIDLSVLGLTGVQMFFVMILLVCTVDGTDENTLKYKYINDGCQTEEDGKGDDYRGAFVDHRTNSRKYGVRCCSMNGSSCITIGSCPADFKTYDDAVKFCTYKR